MKPSFTPQDIVVADRCLFPFIYELKDRNPDFCFDLIDADQLLNLVSFDFVNPIIPELLIKGFSYPNAKRYSLLLRMGLADKNEEAKSFLNSLGPTGIKRDPLGVYELTLGQVYFLEMEEDIELHRLAKEAGASIQDIRLGDLGIEMGKPNRESLLFTNKFEQFAHIFALIRKKLLLDPTYAKKCYIQISGLADVFYARQIGTLFGVETYYRYRAPLLGKEEYRSIYQDLCERKSLSFKPSPQNLLEAETVFGLIKEYRLGELDVESALARLYEILSSSFVNEQIGDRGILLSDSFSVQTHKEVYLTCFQDGPFYKRFADDDLFSDKDLSSMGFNPSYVKTALEKRKKGLLLNYANLVLVSRVKEHLSDIIYDSPFKKELGYSERAVTSVEPNGTFTSSFFPLVRGTALDASFYPLPMEELKSYDSRFKGIPNYRPPEKTTFSVTNLESYPNCPYAYYLRTVLPENDFDRTAMNLGIMLHKVLEDIEKDDYDYDASFAKGTDAYAAQMAKYHQSVGPREELLFAVAKENFKRTVAILRSSKAHSKLAYSYSELRLEWSLNDGTNTYRFTGIADKVSVYKDGAKTFYVVTDYKTGKENFMPYASFLGLSTQLPLYAYAIKNGGAKKDIEGIFAGIGLQHVYPNSLKSAFAEKNTFAMKNGYNTLGLDGVYLNNPDFWRVFDDTVFDGDGELKEYNGYYAHPGDKTFDASGKGFLSGISKGRPYSLQELMDDAVKGTLETIHHIQKGEFPIAPSPRDPNEKVSPDSVCRYCTYKDVCYRNLARDARELVGTVKEYFREKKGGKSDGEVQ